ncbi:uroporphyrinogen-III C-methyltransferase [Parafilimonas sp.]|uniref:uroporphyrinogen-III C-methyltransferase n=1 Tax=Parafilimonas sp. TaxID=1969739 RepID=UPI0039E3B2C1
MSNAPTEKRNTGAGKIYFIGAGPGNPDLITVKGANLLAQAEVIITDRLAGDEIIERYASPNAIIIDVGKQGGNEKSYKQTDINKLLVQFASLYEKVVRLKGGDIAFFSNVYDELLTVVEHNIEYEIVPGITAASGASAYTGVPLTTRNHASGVQMLTYFNNGIINKETWKQLAAFKETLVFYMSSNNLLSIIEKLLNAGADATIPFIVAEQVTTPKQRVHSFTLQSFLNAPSHFESPSIVIMGRVAGLHKTFAWHNIDSAATGNYFRSVDAATGYLKINAFTTTPAKGKEKVSENVD